MQAMLHDTLGWVGMQVDDEHHMIFDCEAFSDIRSQYPGMFDEAQTIRDFFDQSDDDALLSFISECMQIVDELNLDAEQPR